MIILRLGMPKPLKSASWKRWDSDSPDLYFLTSIFYVIPKKIVWSLCVHNEGKQLYRTFICSYFVNYVQLLEDARRFHAPLGG